MKNRIAISIIFALGLLIAGCTEKNEQIRYAPGHIPGMGRVGGELTGTPFSLPAGVECVGEIVGGVDGFAEGVPITGIDAIGGSGGDVKLLMTFRNALERDIDMILPVGLTFKSLFNVYQNALLVKTIHLTIPARSTSTSLVLLYGLNAGRERSIPDARYEFGPMTDVPLILDLCDRLADTKINIIDYPELVEQLVAGEVPRSEDYKYYEYAEHVQGMIRKITYDGFLLDSGDLTYIKNMEAP